MRLIAENLAVVRGVRTVLADLSFTAASGSALVITGANGAGKTTLLRALAGFLRPAAGRVRLEGGADDVEIAEQCHFVGHLPAIKANLTIAETVRFWVRYLSPSTVAADAEVAARAALARFGLDAVADVPAGLLSAGQKRRAALARLVAVARPIWLLDEPTASLDTASAGIVAEVLTRHLAGGGIAVVATHLPLGLEHPVYLRIGAPPSGAPPMDALQ